MPPPGHGLASGYQVHLSDLTPPILLLALFTASLRAAAPTPVEDAATSSSDQSTSDQSTSDQSTSDQSTSDPSTSDPSTSDKTSDTLATGPDIYLLPDAEGRLRRVLGYRYDDFQKAWRSEASKPVPRLPPWTLTRIVLTGNADAQTARVRIEIDVLLQTSGWVAVPLALDSLAVSQTEIGGGALEEFLAVGVNGRALAAWVHAAPGERRQIVVEGEVMLHSAGADHQLQLELPSAVQSTLRLTIPYEDALAESSDGSVVRIGRLDAGHSVVEGTTQGGLLSLHWRPRVTEEAVSAAPYEAIHKLSVTIDPELIRYDSSFSLQTYGHALDRVEVELPPGSELVRQPDSPMYEVSLVQKRSAENRTDGAGQVVEVRFRDPTSVPPEVRLVAERMTPGERDSTQPGGAVDSPDGEAATRDFTLTAPRLIGAFRQSGVAAIRVNEHLLTHHELDGGVEQIAINELPNEMQEVRPRAAFSFSAAPWSIRLFTSPSLRRARVRPSYKLHISPQGAELDVEYEYRIVGGKTFRLLIELKGWEDTDSVIESGGSVQGAGTWHEPDILSLSLNDPDATQVRLRFKLRRDAALPRLSLELPRPRDAYVLPASIELSSDSGILVTPRIVHSHGIALVEEDPGSSLATGGESSDVTEDAQMRRKVDEAAIDTDSSDAKRVQRLQAYLDDARLTLDVVPRAGEVHVQRRVDVNIDANGAKVVERLLYRVEHQPIRQLMLRIPKSLAENETLEFLLNGSPLPSAALRLATPKSDATAVGVGQQLATVALPREMQGELNIALHFDRPLDEQEGRTGRMLTIPLAAAEEEATGASAIVRAPPRWQVALAANDAAVAWSQEVPDAQSAVVADSIGAASFQADVGVDALALVVADPQSQIAEVVVDRLWLQTWIAGNVRQDRFAARCWTSSDRILAALPARAVGRVALWHCDGIPLQLTPDAQGRVEIPCGERSQFHTIEVQFQDAAPLGEATQLAADPISIEGARRGGPIFWQIVVPPNYAALSPPRGLVPEYRLQWQDFRWGRQPTQEQTDLQQWTEAIDRAPPSPQTSRYVYSGFDWPPHCRVTIVRRAWLMTLAALAIFGVGSAFLFTSVAARRGVQWSVALAVAGLLVAHPETGVALLEATVVAIVLTGGAWLLRRILLHPASNSIPIGGPTPSSTSSHLPTQLWTRDADADSSPNVHSTAPLAAPGSTP